MQGEKRYALRIREDIYRRAKMKAVSDDLTMKDMFHGLLKLYAEGKIDLKGKRGGKQ